MVSGKYSALSGAITRQQSIDNVSANLANVNTVGYKKARMSFEAMLRGQRQIEDTKGINYNRVNGNYVDFSQGPLQVTDNPLDVAINGNGFFKIRTSEGDLLTRNGHFVLGPDGRLQNDTGQPVLGAGNAEIFIADETIQSIVIDKEGIIYSVNDGGDTTEIGQLAVVDVAYRAQLERRSDNAFALRPQALEVAADDFTVSQGSLEVSNVNMTVELTKMIYDNRLFQAYHNVLQSYSSVGEQLEDLGTLA